jgi:transcriptional regulator with XRE-family HTH domain
MTSHPHDPDLAAARRRVFGARLAQLRRWRELSGERLAEHAGLHRTSVVNLETGRTGPEFDTLWKISEALRLEPADLLRNTWPDDWPDTPPPWPRRSR